jgi:hypothetical protein
MGADFAEGVDGRVSDAAKLAIACISLDPYASLGVNDQTGLQIARTLRSWSMARVAVAASCSGAPCHELFQSGLTLSGSSGLGGVCVNIVVTGR